MTLFVTLWIPNESALSERPYDPSPALRFAHFAKSANFFFSPPDLHATCQGISAANATDLLVLDVPVAKNLARLQRVAETGKVICQSPLFNSIQFCPTAERPWSNLGAPQLCSNHYSAASGVSGCSATGGFGFRGRGARFLGFASSGVSTRPLSASVEVSITFGCSIWLGSR